MAAVHVYSLRCFFSQKYYKKDRKKTRSVTKRNLFILFEGIIDRITTFKDLSTHVRLNQLGSIDYFDPHQQKQLRHRPIKWTHCLCPTQNDNCFSMRCLDVKTDKSASNELLKERSFSSIVASDFNQGTSTAEENLREQLQHNMLTMATIGCLSDNVQQAVKSFSIRPDKQYITFAFPFMEDITRRFGEILHVPEMGCSSERPHCITPALLFDQCLEVVHGFQTYVTFAPCMNRNSLPIVLLTLYQQDTTEGLKRHFESLVRILLKKTTLLSIWKLPLLVTNLDNKLLDVITDACTYTVMDIQIENLHNTFPGKSSQELFTLVKKFHSPTVQLVAIKILFVKYEEFKKK
uniref:Uncharacterized protein n=1 Tax=Strigamia maritima TaxID=126957 RepID=T1J5B2_STRMM